MYKADNESLVRRYLDEVFNKGNLGAIDEFLSPNFRRHTSPAATPMTRDVQRQRFMGFRAAFPDIRISIEDALAVDDRVAIRTLLQGTHRGELMGISPTGKPVSFYTVDILRIENEQIAEQWGGPDLLGLIYQLGGVVSAPQA